MKIITRGLLLVFLSSMMVGCAVIAVHKFDQEFGLAAVRSRQVTKPPNSAPSYMKVVKPILDNRCVVCHACYDAPCQVKLSSIEGIDRGANKTKVYDGERLLAIKPSRLFVDAENTAAWRSHKFFPILNERLQNSFTNLELSTLYQMLVLKRKHPLPDTTLLPDSFDFKADRNQQCPTIEEYDAFEKKHPLWGMPYGLPQLSDAEFNILKSWIEHGAKVEPVADIPKRELRQIKRWEEFFNRKDNKSQLMNRYIYEHLFFAHLYFSELPTKNFYKIVRSKTPPGQPIKQINTRRPYDDPRREKFYYRLWKEKSSISAKTHMPYALSAKRMRRWKELFLEPDYRVANLPSYEVEVAANPFITYRDIPVRSRYRFMLDEAEFTIMGFIKGPVCRGRIALNVIEDRFWVTFVNPDAPELEHEDRFLAEQSKHLSLPIEAASNALPISTWVKYSLRHKKYMSAKAEYLSEVFPDLDNITLDIIWNGDGNNKNSALTVFRHSDVASVVKGFVGAPPKTSWVVSYNLLERIHYLLVAGFDVFGNLGHQLNARLYMDFLRMEAENNFLYLLPPEVREEERNYWYRGIHAAVSQHIRWPQALEKLRPNIEYKTGKSKRELFNSLREHLGETVDTRYSKLAAKYAESIVDMRLLSLNGKRGEFAQFLPQLSFVRIHGRRGSRAFTMTLDNGYSNVSTPLFESYRRIPKEDEVTIVPGLLGASPNAFFDIKEKEVEFFLNELYKVQNEDDYREFYGKFGIRRNSASFWPFSDWLHTQYNKESPIEAGLFDYNRFENR